MKFKDILFDKLEKLAVYILLLLSILFAISLSRNIVKIRKVSEKIEDKKIAVDNLKKENEDLAIKIEKVKSDEYIEEKLRNNLGLVKEGEIVIVLPDAEVVKKLAPQKETVKDELPDPTWKKWLNMFL